MKKREPIFKSIFGKDWDNLPPVMKKHYAIYPYTNDVVTVEGVLDVMCRGPIKIMALLFWLLRGIPPHNEKDVEVIVNFKGDPATRYFYFNRIFKFKKRPTYNFRSRMLQVRDNEVIELMSFGVGWRMKYFWEDDRVKLKHAGYVLPLLGFNIPIPLTMLLGEGYAEEIAIDDHTFEMCVDIIHPWWGKIYQYKGRFKVREHE